MPLFPKLHAFGLDIGDTSIKAALVKRSRHSFKLAAFIKLRRAPNGPRRPLDRSSELAQLLPNLLKQKILKETPLVAVSIAESQAYVQHIYIDEALCPQLADCVLEAIKNEIPEAPKDLVFDWIQIDKYDNKTRILLACAPKDAIDKMISLLMGAGLIPAVIEPQVIASTRCFVNGDESSPRLFLEIGTGSSILCFWAGSIIHTQIINSGGETWTRKIAEGLNISNTLAEYTKKRCGLDPKTCSGVVRDALDEALTSFAEKTEKAISYLEHHHRAPKNLLLEIFGGGANLSQITQELTKKMNRQVILVRTRSDLSELFSKIDPKLRLEAPAAVGLALRGLEPNTFFHQTHERY